MTMMTEFGKGFFFGIVVATCITSVINIALILILDHLKERRNA